MSIEAIRELETLASVCPELNMANYTEDDVRHLNDWAIEMSLLVERYALSQQPDNVACKSVQKRLAAQQPATTEPVAWMHWLNGPVRVFMNKDVAMMELDRLNREYPLDADDRKMRPLVFGDTAQQPATAIACGIPGMAKTTCPYCEQGFAFEHEQPATSASVQADSSEHLRVVASLGDALRRLSFAAQTTGGTDGPDAELQSAIGQAEQALSLGGIWQAMSATTEPVADGVPDGVHWFTVTQDGMPDFGEEVIGGFWYTDPWLKPDCATRFMWGQCRVVKDDHRDFKDGKRWQTFGPSHNDITHWARLKSPAHHTANHESQNGE